MNQNIWPIIIIVAVVAICLFLFFIRRVNTKPTQITKSNIDLTVLFTAIGGKENLVKSEANGSKVIFTLKNTKAISQDGLKALGASGIVVSKERVTVIFGKSSEVIVKEIEQVQ